MEVSDDVFFSWKGHKQLKHTISGLLMPGPCPGPALLKGLPERWLSGIVLNVLKGEKNTRYKPNIDQTHYIKFVWEGKLLNTQFFKYLNDLLSK